MFTRGLDRRVLVSLRVELTHAAAVSNLYRAILRGMMDALKGNWVVAVKHFLEKKD